MENPIHLGDGVYAFHDGFGIELRVNDHRNPHAVYLEPDVLHALVMFAQRMHEAKVATQRKEPA